MAPDPGNRTVGAALSKAVPDANHQRYIETAVNRVHEATIRTSELLNIHIRRCIRDNVILEQIFQGNWIMKAFYEVTYSNGKNADLDPELSESMKFMPEFRKCNRNGLTQLMLANANLLATTAHNNVWMHFRARILAHVQRIWKLPSQQYESKSKEEKKALKLQMFRLATDLIRPDGEQYTCAEDKHEWIKNERLRLGIDDAIGDWDQKPLIYHLKQKAHKFLPIMAMMSQEKEEAGQKAFSLFPLRRSMVPKHIRFDKKSLSCTLEAMRNEEQGRKRKRKDDTPFTFDSVINYKCIRTTKEWQIKDGFTTDGVCIRLQQVKRNITTCGGCGHLPSRGIWAIDELKHLSRLEDLHVIGIDPGKRELINAVDQDDTKSSSVRYTLAERLKHLRTRQYRDEIQRAKPGTVRMSEEDMSSTNSKSASLETFARYVEKRNDCFEEKIEFYAQLCHRHRRWKTYIKSQKSEQKLYQKLQSMHDKSDSRKLVLAYGTWGMIAGKKSSCNKKNPPCIGVGLMRKIAKRFLVALTPEHYTSKTCCRCLSECGPWKELEAKQGHKIRGLRICQNVDCNLPQNRDHTGACNIGLQFCRLFEGKGPIRKMTKEDIEFNNHNLCMQCDDD